MASGDEERLAPGLYVVATPIGNLKDITLRALDVLRGADLILCEDKRVSAKILSHYSIRTPGSSYHDYSGRKERAAILKRLSDKARIALISDAGTPLISDPGFKLVRDVLEAGLPVFTVPGPSALIAALSISGLPSDQFHFAGFLPAKAGARRKSLESLARIPGTLIFYETGPRLAESLADMTEILGPREAVIARELTKKFEQIVCAPLPDLAARNQTPPKGEIVVLVAPAEPRKAGQQEIDAAIADALKTKRLSEAVRETATELNLSKREVYQRALKIKRDRDNAD